jgi:glycosyltransferase involved in cell wall biosynthesis
MLGRAADKIKGIIYAIKAMPFIVKEVPDAKLILLSSSYSIQFLRDLAKELKVENNINFNYYTEDISKVFWDSSVLMYTSLSEAFPLAMVEGKAHGLPVVAFDVACSPPYQSGVINVDMLDCEALANETVKLLKNEEYRKQKGKEAKLSLEHFNNVETEQIWEKLFKSLMKGNRYFREFQKEIEEKYYDEDKARIRMEKRYRDVLKLYKNFTCHTLNDFTRLSYVKHIKPCPNISESDNNK